jgi:hypothetical protein
MLFLNSHGHLVQAKTHEFFKKAIDAFDAWISTNLDA